MRALTPITQLTLLVCFVVIGASAVTGCPGEIEDPDRFKAGSNCDVEGDLFPRRCAIAGCHDDMTLAGDLDMASPGLDARVVGVPATIECNSAILVDPDNPAQSVMYTKLTPDFCGLTQMPQTGAKLTEEELQCVFDWIASRTPGPVAASSSTGMGGMPAVGGMGGMGVGGAGGVGGN